MTREDLSMTHDEGTTPDANLTVLLVDDDEDDFILFRDYLSETDTYRFTVDWCPNYDKAVSIMARNVHDACVLDYRLGIHDGLELLEEAMALGATGPFVFLTGQGSREIDIAAMKAGAYDYLIKQELTPAHLERVLRYAVEQKRLIDEIRTLSLVDNLTGLYNRRGLMTLAEQQYKVARRYRHCFSVMFADLDNLKWINDTYGHVAGDEAIRTTADILRHSFRETDIIARLGGDEFVVIFSDYIGDISCSPLKRLDETLHSVNTRGSLRYQISISRGVTHFLPEDPSPLQELIDTADTLMYKDKQSRKCMA